MSAALPLAKIALVVFVGVALHLVAMAVAGALLGGAPRELSVGYGPVVGRLRVRGVSVRLRIVPLGGYVAFWRRDDDPPPPPGTRLFDELPGYRRAAAQLAGPAVLLVAGFALAGEGAFRAAWGGAKGFVLGALAPTGAGADLLAEVLGAGRIQPLLPLFGLAFGVIAGFNLLPLPTLNGGAALLEVLVSRGKSAERFRVVVAVVGTLVALAALVSWIVAAVTLARR